MKKILLFSLIVVLLSACVAGDGSSSLSHPAGFFTGIWHGEAVSLVIGLAGIGEEHMMILSNVATVFGEMEAVEKVLKNQNIDEIYDLLTQSEEA